MVTTVISLAHSLGLTVVAEGLETEAQAAELKRRGCDELQGYLVSERMIFEQVAERLAAAERRPTRYAKQSAG